MLLKQLLISPKTSSNLLVYDPFGEPDRQALVREVIGLANADVDGPRNILFGVNPAVVEGDGIVGISDGAADELKRAHRLISALIEPTLHLAFTYDKFNGKLIGALEIDGCDFGPYFVAQDYSDTLVRGGCWVRDGRKLHSVERASLIGSAAPAGPTAAAPALSADDVDVAIGFGGDPESQYLELPIPDASNPPFAEEYGIDSKPSSIGQVIKDTVNTVTTQMLRLGQNATHANPDGTLTDGSATGLTEYAGKIFVDAQNHYYFEEKAVQVGFCIRNEGKAAIEKATVEFGFPRLPDFDVADRLHVSPFDKRSPNEIRNMGYPDVESRDEGIFARSVIESLAAGETLPALLCPLRMAVGPAMKGRKLGISYTLRGPDNGVLSKGTLKIRFGDVSA